MTTQINCLTTGTSYKNETPDAIRKTFFKSITNENKDLMKIRYTYDIDKSAVLTLHANKNILNEIESYSIILNNDIANHLSKQFRFKFKSEINDLKLIINNMCKVFLTCPYLDLKIRIYEENIEILNNSTSNE
jgi:hypothetical protein